MRDGRVRLGIISHEPVRQSMAGPAIRCWELARALSGTADVILLTPEPSDLEEEGFEIAAYTEADIVSRAADCDALLCQGFILQDYPGLKQLGKSIIVDLYVPITLEALAQYEHRPEAEQDRIQGHILKALMDQLLTGSFFICASERQRDYWLGMLSAAGRLTAGAYAGDASLRRLIDVVPFGLPDQPPAARGRALKGVRPGINEDDKVVLWGGGIYNWLDPFTPIRAMAKLSAARDDVKLFFLGARHPDPNVPRMRAYDEAVELSRELGVLDKTVFFNDSWVAYEDRVDYLLEADMGASANIPHIETRFSFRTRILDCVWASLPVVATEGDSLSSMVQHQGLGLVVESGDADAFAAAIQRLVDDDELRGSCRENLEKAAAGLRWSRVAMPLKQCLSRLNGGATAPVQRLAVADAWEKGLDASAGQPRAAGMWPPLRARLARAARKLRTD